MFKGKYTGKFLICINRPKKTVSSGKNALPMWFLDKWFWVFVFNTGSAIFGTPEISKHGYGYGYGGKTGVTGCSNLKEPIQEFKELIVCDTISLDSAKVFFENMSRLHVPILILEFCGNKIVPSSQPVDQKSAHSALIHTITHSRSVLPANFHFQDGWCQSKLLKGSR